jgi:hypothetical protein
LLRTGVATLGAFARAHTISYLPHNTTTGVALLIEDDEEAAVIANRMLAEGVPVDREEID